MRSLLHTRPTTTNRRTGRFATGAPTASLAHRRPPASVVGFAFTLSAPAKVTVTLVKQTSDTAHKRWSTLPDSLTLSLAAGHTVRTLKGHNRLSPRRYRLTVKPSGGRSRAIYLSTRR
jgi:hypothetical protein